MGFEFWMPVKTFVEENAVVNHAAEFAAYGKRCLIVTGAASAKKSGALDDVTAALEQNGVEWRLFDRVGQNPLLSVCHEAGRAAAGFGADFMVGIGGGSPLDATKAAAVFAANPGMEPMELYKGWDNHALPFLLVGTTAGTGSEVTRFSVITVDETGRKQSWGNAQSYAKAVFGDPRYTMSLSRDFTISTGLDAVSHSLEAYFSNIEDEVSDIFAIEALKLLLPTLKDVWASENMPELSQRTALYTGSIYAGMSLNRCGTAFCHQMSYLLTEEQGVPHGYACTVFLPELVQRAVPVMPQKARRLFGAVGMYAGELCDTLKMIGGAQYEPVSDEALEDFLKRCEGSANMRRSPGNFDSQKQREVAVKILQKKN